MKTPICKIEMFLIVLIGFIMGILITSLVMKAVEACSH